MTLSLLLLCVAGATTPAADVLARVDAVAITRADYDERARALAVARTPRSAADVVSDLVDEALLAAEAKRLGIDREPAVVAQVERQRRRLLVEAYVEELGRAAEPTDAALRELYHSTGDAVRLVLVKLASEADARAALERVRKGGDLAVEARRGLDAQLAARGGDTGWVVRAGLAPPLAEAAFRAAPGELVGPVALTVGWAIARVVEQRVGDEAGFAARKEALVAFARRQHAERSRAHVLSKLERQAAVKLDEEFLRSLGVRAEATPDELARVIATVNGTPLHYRDIHPAAARLLRSARHGVGPSVRIELASKEIEERLLAGEALARGLGRAPAVVAAMPGIERNLAASALAERIGERADLSDPAVAKRVAALRRAARVRLERDKVAALERR